MIASIRNVLIVIAGLVVASPASAHPHVWVTMTSELIYAPDGSITGIRQHWVFDDMFSAFSTQGLESKEKGKFTREELAPLAKVNVESLKDYGYFTYATADGAKAPLADPLPDYWLDYKDEILTLHFTLPFKPPVKAKNLVIEVYDPTYFVDMEMAKDNAVRLVGAPAACKFTVALPRELTYAEGKILSNNPESLNNWGANFANKISVTCP
jgi:ABC-type uncharacterized transport system substrate-binding protein